MHGVSAFQKGQKIEAFSRTVFETYMKRQGVKVRWSEDLPNPMRRQFTVGDGTLEYSDTRVEHFELKAEQRYTGNFFLETYSNELTGRPGWLQSSQADVLYYLFLGTRVLYCMDMDKLQQWAYQETALGSELVPQIERYDHKVQQKYSQDNQTSGHIVPIGVLEKEVGCKMIRLDARVYDKCFVPWMEWQKQKRPLPASGPLPR